MIDLRKSMEHWGRNKAFRRKLPKVFGDRPIWVSPDARLRYLKPGSRGFDAELLDFIDRVIRTDDVILDIGGNVGEFTLAAAHKSENRSSVLAVEPDPYLASLITKTSHEPENTGLGIMVLCAAVSKQSGISKFYVSERGRASSALAECGDRDMGGVRFETLVPIVTIDMISEAWRVPNVIKIDVEGAELSVLQGAGNVLKKHRPVLLIETRKDKKDIQKLLTDCGYCLYDLKDRDLHKQVSSLPFDTFAIPEENLDELQDHIVNGKKPEKNYGVCG